jgi:hypothetical protein
MRELERDGIVITRPGGDDPLPELVAHGAGRPNERQIKLAA